MANDGTAFIRTAKQANAGEKIFLVGWSRGAAACIQVALDLDRAGYEPKIDALFLFDAVDQDGSTPDFLNYIPKNVINVYHAIATGKSWFDRQIFPTCGKTHANGVNVVEHSFNTTHGGVAGAGETDAGSRVWMWNNFRTEGVL